MFGLGPTELFLGLVVILLLFGAKRIPEIARGLGKGIREFKSSMRDINSEFDQTDKPNSIHEPMQRPQVRSAEKEPAAREE